MRALHAEHAICAVLTSPDRPAGRGRELLASPVKSLALELGLPILQPDRLGSESREAVAALSPDLLVVVAYGHIFGPKFLTLFAKGAINLHPSLLPRHRGPSPIAAAILAGDRETGITIQRLALEVDAGPVLKQLVIPLGERETTATLSETVAREGAALLAEVCRNIDRITETVQDPGLATYTRLITKEDGIVDWRLSAEEIDRMVRAFTPWPHARTTFRGGELHLLEASPVGRVLPAAASLHAAPESPGRVVGIDTQEGILVQTGSGVLGVRMLQLPSKKPLHWKDFVNGVRDLAGSTFGGPR